MIKQIINRNEAENLAVDALLFIAKDPDLLPRFLNITGITASDIRTAAKTHGFLAGVLSFLLAHEPTLLMFANDIQISPELVQKAFLLLPGGEQNEWV